MPFLVLGNKLDVEDGMRKVTTDEASRYCKQNNLIYFETSAKNNTNIESAFLELVKKIVKR